jgi:hypothetical protein
MATTIYGHCLCGDVASSHVWHLFDKLEDLRPILK